jgi:hypothetical protein
VGGDIDRALGVAGHVAVGVRGERRGGAAGDDRGQLVDPVGGLLVVWADEVACLTPSRLPAGSTIESVVVPELLAIRTTCSPVPR